MSIVTERETISSHAETGEKNWGRGSGASSLTYTVTVFFLSRYSRYPAMTNTATINTIAPAICHISISYHHKIAKATEISARIAAIYLVPGNIQSGLTNRGVVIRTIQGIKPQISR